MNVVFGWRAELARRCRKSKRSAARDGGTLKTRFSKARHPAPLSTDTELQEPRHADEHCTKPLSPLVHRHPLFIRLALSVVFRAPPAAPAPPKWQQSLAHAMHWVLYGFLIVMPFLGWLALSAKGNTIPFFGYELHALMGPDKALGKSVEDIHGTIGALGYYLIGLHALAALFHHHFMRDNTLQRMLPWRARSTISRRGDAMREIAGAPPA